MAVALSRISCWLMGDQKKPRRSKSSSKAPQSNDYPSGYHEPESVKVNFQTLPGSSSSRRLRKPRQNSKEKRVDKEYDMVIVPSDGVCMSGSESDGSDWSIGWTEPHSNEFCNSDGESEESFAVLVPCYARGIADAYPLDRNNNAGFGFGIRDPIRDGFSDNKELFEQWLSSLPQELL